MASLYKRGNIYWVIVYNKETRKADFHSTGETDPKRADKERKRIEAEYKLGIHKPKEYKNSGVILLSESVELFFSGKRLSKAAKVAYQQSINKLILASGDKFLFKYDDSDYHKLLKYFKEKDYSSHTASSYTNQLKIFFNWAVKKDYIKHNPVVKIKADRIEVKTIPLWTLGRILNHCSKREHYYIIKLAYLGAFRKGEILNCHAEDFDLTNKVLYIRNSKGKRIDGIPLTKDTIKCFNKMNVKSGKLFGLGYEGVKTFWNTIKRNLDIDYTFHSLRKTRGTYLANIGVEPLFLKQYMRHKDFRTTLTYYINTDINKARNSIDSKL